MKRLLSTLLSLIVILNSIIVFAHPTEKSFFEGTPYINEELSSSSAIDSLKSIISSSDKYPFDRNNMSAPPEYDVISFIPEAPLETNDENTKLFSDSSSYDANIKLNAHFDESKNIVIDFNGSNLTNDYLDYIVFISCFDSNNRFFSYIYYGDCFFPYEKDYAGFGVYKINSDFLPKGTSYTVKAVVFKSFYSNEINAYTFDNLTPLTQPLIANVSVDGNIKINGYHSGETTETTSENPTETSTEEPTETTTTNYVIDSNYVKKIRTSYYQDNLLEFAVNSDNNVTIKGKVVNPEVEEALCYFKGQSYSYADVYIENPNTGEFDITLDTSILSNGIHNINLYLNNTYGSYTSYITDIQVLKENDQVYIVIPYDIYKDNMDVFNTNAEDFSTDYYLTQENYWFTTDEDEMAEIEAKVLEVINKAGAKTDYEKILAIHDFVANYVYYDYDYLYGREETTNITDIAVLRNGYSVCHGYTVLFMSMARKAGIPTRMVTGFTRSSESWEERLENPITDHAWNEAYIDGRWAIIDVTWNSHLKKGYENPYELTGTENKATYRYFDISPEFFAFNHKIESYEK